MKLLAACEDTGAFKLVVAGHGTDTSKKDAIQPEKVVNLQAEERTRHQRVLQMVKNEATGHILVTRLDGSVESYSFDDEEDDLTLLAQHKTVLAPFVRGEQTEMFVTLTCMAGRVFAATNKGQIFIWKSEEALVQTPMVYQLPISQELEVVKIHPGDGDLVVFGGKDVDLSVYKLPDLKKQSKKQPTLVFKAKNINDKRLDMQMRIHIKDLQVLPESSADNFKILTFTAFGEMRTYETSQGKKPRSNFKVVDKSIITTHMLSNGDAVVADEKAQVVQVRVADGAPLCKFKGQFGSVECIGDFKGKILATGGLDRYVRAYYVNSRECIVKVYLGTQVNNVIVLEDSQFVEKVKPAPAAVAEKKKREEEEEEEDDDEMWTKLESKVVEKRKRRKIIL